MTEFVVWLGLTIEDAVDAKNAAEQAQKMIQREGSNWMYKVTDCESGKVSVIDLLGC